MALKLKKVDTRVFRGNPGDTVRLDASVAKVAGDTPASIAAITYNGVTVKSAPFEFKVVAGDNGVVVVFVSKPGTQVFINEVDTADPGERQTLAKSFYDPGDPSVVILIKA